MTKLITLGIESTAHTFGVSILRGEEFLSNKKDLFRTKKGGMIPSEVADHHVDVCDKLFLQAIKEAKINIKDIDIIAFSQSPGIGHMLRIGAVFARSLSLLLKKPLIPVNHCIAHLEIGRFLSKLNDPLLVYASGANTQIIAFKEKKYRIFGETLDVGLGNFLDSFGRSLGIGFPAGPKIEELAEKGKTLIDLPYSVKGMDVSFGGMLTNLKQKIEKKIYSFEDLCYSVQETVFAMLTEVTERALSHTGKKEVILGGGVACNKRLQKMIKDMCVARDVKFFCPQTEFLVDNAAMIALTGSLIYSTGIKQNFKDSIIEPYKRTDAVLVEYRH